MSPERTYLDDGLSAERGGRSPLWVIPKDLCTRCGVCHVICPTDVVRFDAAEFPYIEEQGCIDCGLCLQVCPGIEFDFPRMHREMFGEDYAPLAMGGKYRQAYMGWSTRQEIRANAAAGGVVTQMLIELLDSGQIDGAVVVGNDPADPTRAAPLIARSEEEVRAAAQSKYSVVANTKVLRGFRRRGERFAFVGVACQIHGLKKLQELNRRFRERAALVIGLACRGTFENDAIRDLLALRHLALRSVERIEYRGGPFPGKFRAHMAGGSITDLHRFEYKDGAYNTLLRLYLPERCHLCPDYSAEFSDITCSDIWLRGKDGQYLYPGGATLVLCRTERGEQAVEAMIASGKLALKPLDPATVERAYGHLRRERKVFPFVQIARRSRRGQRVPQYGFSAPATAVERLLAAFYRLTFLLGRSAPLRRRIVRLLFSRLGEGMVFVKITYKKYRHRLKARLAG